MEKIDMHHRREFLSNIVGISATPFIGKIVNASEKEVSKFGSPSTVLAKRKEVYSDNQMIIRAYCYSCDQNIRQLLSEYNNSELKYHVYSLQELPTIKFKEIDVNKIIILVPQ